MPNLRGKTWTTTTPANVGDAQYWEDHLISDAAAAKAASSVQSVNSIPPDQNGNVEIGNAGHTIQDDDGNDMPKQDVLQFVNADVTNDTVNEKTVVDCKGAKGDAATITVGTVTTLPAGSDATVTNSGTSHAAVFNFGIPQGEDGSGAVDSVNGKTGTVVLTATDIGALPDNAPVILTSTTAGLVKNDGTIDTTEYQTKLSFDTAPVKDSTKPVESGGIYDALAPKVSESLLKDTVGWVGKNRLPIPSSVVTKTVGEVTFTVTRNSRGEVTEIDVDTNGQTTTTFRALDFFGWEKEILPEGNWILSDVNGSANAYTYINRKKGESGTVNYNIGTSSASSVPVNVDYNTYDYFVVGIGVPSGKVADHVKLYPMLRDASITDSTFEPYHKSVEDWYWENNPNAGVKNFIGSPTSVGSIFTRNANGSYTANGQPSSKKVLRYDFPTENGKKYKVSGCPDGGSSSTYKMDIWNVGSYFDSTPIEITGDGNTQTIEFAIVANYSANNIVFYPMVVDAQDTSSGFQPPAMTNAELTEKLTTEDVSISIHADASEKITLHNDAYLKEVGGVVSGFVRFNVVSALTNQQNILTFGKAPLKVSMLIAMDVQTKAVLPVFLYANGNVGLFSGSIPTTDHSIVIFTNYITG